MQSWKGHTRTVHCDTLLLDTLNFIGLFLTSISCYCSASSQLGIAAVKEVIKRSVDTLDETYGFIEGMCFYAA